MTEFNLSQEAVAKRVGKARSTVANSLRLLSLPEEIKTALAKRLLSEAHAKYLLGLSSEAQQLNVFRKILRQNLTVSDTNRLIRRLGGTKEARVKDSTLLDKEQRLAKALGTRVTIERKMKGGRVIIDFYSDEELGELTKRLIKE
jgi:ParB family chromosome partitioning protein